MPRAPMSDAQKEAMAEGRRKAAAARRAEAEVGASSRVDAYRAWVRADAAWHSVRASGMDPGPRPKMPPVLPSKNDYDIVNGVDPDEED